MKLCIIVVNLTNNLDYAAPVNELFCQAAAEMLEQMKKTDKKTSLRAFFKETQKSHCLSSLQLIASLVALFILVFWFVSVQQPSHKRC